MIMACWSSVWTTRTGRSLAVRRLESGKTTRATSPRLQSGPRGVVVVIDIHLRTIPVRGESREPGSQLSRVRLVDPVRSEVDAVWPQEGHQDRHFLVHVNRPLGQLDLALSVDAFDRPQHTQNTITLARRTVDAVAVLEEAQRKGAVRIKRRDGETHARDGN